MQINIVLIVVVLLMLGGTVKGFQNGLVKELSTLIGLIGALAAGAAVIAALHNYQNKNIAKTVTALICFVVVLLAYKIIDFILASFKLISRIPLLGGVNKLLGAAAGLGEGIVVVWIAFLLITAFDVAGIRSVVLANIGDDEFLRYLFYNNYIAKGLAELGDVKDVLMELW